MTDADAVSQLVTDVTDDDCNLRGMEYLERRVAELVAAARADEREACEDVARKKAVLWLEEPNRALASAASIIGDAIRARGDK